MLHCTYFPMGPSSSNRAPITKACFTCLKWNILWTLLMKIIIRTNSTHWSQYVATHLKFSPRILICWHNSERRRLQRDTTISISSLQVAAKAACPARSRREATCLQTTEGNTIASSFVIWNRIYHVIPIIPSIPGQYQKEQPLQD